MVDALVLDDDVRGIGGCVLLALEERVDVELGVGATARARPETGITTLPTVWRATSSLPLSVAGTAREAAAEVYKPELDAGVADGEVAFTMTSREEGIRTATSPSSLRTTWPPALRRMGWMLPCFEGESMTISR